jgi:RNA polymerase sigma factor (TIGR02999 family)
MGRETSIIALLNQLKDGDKAVLDQIVPLVYAELHRMASNYLRGEYVQNTLQTTALVHEAYLRLAGGAQLDCQSLAHFYGIAARTMRQILVDHARVRNAAKRGAGAVHVPIDDALDNFIETPGATIALDDALKALEKQDPEKARLVELRFFGGLTAEESARLLELPLETVRHRLRLAQAWLRREIAEQQG